MVILRNILSVWTALERKQHMIIEYFLLRKFFFLEEIRVCNSLQKQLSFSSVGWIYLLVKRIERIPRSTRLLRLLFRSLSFSCHFSDFFGKKNRQTNGQYYLPTQESTASLPKTDQNTISPQCRLSWKPLLEKLQLIYLQTNDHVVSNVDT